MLQGSLPLWWFYWDRTHHTHTHTHTLTYTGSIWNKNFLQGEAQREQKCQGMLLAFTKLTVYLFINVSKVQLVFSLRKRGHQRRLKELPQQSLGETSDAFRGPEYSGKEWAFIRIGRGNCNYKQNIIHQVTDYECTHCFDKLHKTQCGPRIENTFQSRKRWRWKPDGQQACTWNQ